MRQWAAHIGRRERICFQILQSRSVHRSAFGESGGKDTSGITNRNSIPVCCLGEKTLNSNVEEVDTAASEMFDRLVEQMKKAEGVTEKLKAENQTEWAGRMNGICIRAEEIVLNDLIYN